MEQRLLSDGQIRAGVTSTADNSGNLDLPVQGETERVVWLAGGLRISINVMCLQTKGTDISISRCSWCKETHRGKNISKRQRQWRDQYQQRCWVVCLICDLCLVEVLRQSERQRGCTAAINAWSMQHKYYCCVAMLQVKERMSSWSDPATRLSSAPSGMGKSIFSPISSHRIPVKLNLLSFLTNISYLQKNISK